MAMRNSNGYTGVDEPKRDQLKCSQALYHVGFIFSVIGTILLIIAIATTSLFWVYIYDHRDEAKFHHVEMPIGLFKVGAYVRDLQKNLKELDYKLEITDATWIAAKALSIIGILCAIGAVIYHIVMWKNDKRGQKCPMLLEICLLFLCIVCLCITLSFAESEIEYIHDNGDPALIKFMLNNRLLNKKEATFKKAQATADAQPTERDENDEYSMRSDFDLVMTDPMFSLYVLIVSIFFYLIAFLLSVLHAVRIMEHEARRRKREQKLALNRDSKPETL